MQKYYWILLTVSHNAKHWNSHQCVCECVEIWRTCLFSFLFAVMNIASLIPNCFSKLCSYRGAGLSWEWGVTQHVMSRFPRDWGRNSGHWGRLLDRSGMTASEKTNSTHRDEGNGEKEADDVKKVGKDEGLWDGLFLGSQQLPGTQLSLQVVHGQ